MKGKKETTVHEPLIKALLKARGLTKKSEIARFLEPSYEDHLHDPFLFRDMDVAVERILLAVKKKERIAVYSDFDCDGIPGASILVQFFQRIEYDNFEVYIPNRHNEGYGLHISAIDKLNKKNIKLIVTVDLGVTAVEQVDYANTLDIDVVVTDHHEPPEILPKAVAVINPKFPPYPDPNLCGAAVAFKLVQALIIEGKKRDLPEFNRIQDGWDKWLLDLVGIATIADMVPLIGENRVLASFGLFVLRKTPRPGIVALMRVLFAQQSEITEDDIGFLIGPRINAASRMGEVEIALSLLTTRTLGEAESLAKQLEALNRKRKGAVAAMTREIKKRLHDREKDLSVTVLGDPSWKPALLGLAANGALDTCGGIVCVWGRDGEGNIKGSCRSDGSSSVVELFRSAEEKLNEFGGHHAAGGFSVSHENIHNLQEIFSEAHGKIDSKKDQGEESIAYALSLMDVGGSLYNTLRKFSPFGIGNEKPLFAFQRVLVESVRQFGKSSEHLEVILVEGNSRVKAVQFFTTMEQQTYQPKSGESVTVFAELERSVFRGVVELRLRLVDICSQSDTSRATIINI